MSLLLVALSSCRRNLLPHTSMHAPNILTAQQGGSIATPHWAVSDAADCRAPLEGKLHNDRIKSILDLCNQWTCESRPALQSTTSSTVERGTPSCTPSLNSHRLHQSVAATIDICNHHQASIISQSQALNALHPHTRRASTSGAHGRCVACKMFQAHASHHA